MCKVLENRSQQDEERMEQLTAQLKEARMLAEDADGKSDEVSRKLAFVEDELEVAEDRVKSGEAKIMELEEELKVRRQNLFALSTQYWFTSSRSQVVGNSLKSLEVSEEKANQRVEEFKREMKTLTVRLKEAENRAENAEKQVKRLQKEVDRLEGNFKRIYHRTKRIRKNEKAFVNGALLKQRERGAIMYIITFVHSGWRA